MAQRRLDGLCFNCPEKFSRDHLKHCTGKGIYILEMSADEDSQDGSESDEDLKISLAAITGIQTSATLHLTARVCDTAATALVDSGSTHSFIDEALAQRLGLTPVPRPGLSVGVANGDRVASAGLCKAVHLVIDKEFTVDLFVIPLGGLGSSLAAIGFALLALFSGISPISPCYFGAMITVSSGAATAPRSTHG